MAATFWVSPVVTGAEVDPTETCRSCAALMVRLAIGGLGDHGIVELPSILLCPDCFVPSRVVDEWRAKVRGH